MAEEKLQYTLTLATRAAGTGAKEVAADMNSVTAAVTAATDKAKVSSFAYYNLDAALKPIPKSANTLGDGVKTMGDRMGKMSMLANQASFQIGDFATQVEMGTGAARAFSQQAPQLIGAFQMAGIFSGPLNMALAGVAAAIPIVTIGVKALSSAMGEVTQPAEKFILDLDAIIKNAAALATIRWDESVASVDNATAHAEANRQTWNLATTAANSASVAAYSNAEKLAAAQEAVNAALGINIDRYAQIQAAADLAEGKRDIEAEQAMQAARSAAAEAARKAQEASDQLQVNIMRRNETKAEIIAQAALLEQLRAKRKELEKIAKTGQQSDMVIGSGFTVGGVPADMSPSRPGAGKKAKEELNSPLFKAQEGSAAVIFEELQARLRSLEEKAPALDNEMDKAVTDAEDQQSASKIAIQSIETNLAGDDTVARANAVVEQSKVLSQGVQTGLTEIHGNLRSVVDIMNQFNVRQAATQAELDRIRRDLNRQSALSSSPTSAR